MACDFGDTGISKDGPGIQNFNNLLPRLLSLNVICDSVSVVPQILHFQNRVDFVQTIDHFHFANLPLGRHLGALVGGHFVWKALGVFPTVIDEPRDFIMFVHHREGGPCQLECIPCTLATARPQRIAVLIPEDQIALPLQLEFGSSPGVLPGRPNVRIVPALAKYDLALVVHAEHVRIGVPIVAVVLVDRAKVLVPTKGFFGTERPPSLANKRRGASGSVHDLAPRVRIG
mmetsp:Transcript_413/g.909  ORF Transcript_413/g.909 Transcript_413/m.909 type:complete len:230 (-) Transcript_413:505-1194(-)